MLRSRIDLPTVAAIGLVASCLANLTHEGLGHGGACLLVGGRPLGLSSAWFEWNEIGVSAWSARFQAAGGTIANLIAGCAALGWLRFARPSRAHTVFFVWILAMLNLFPAGGYLMVSPLAGFGDWKEFLQGLQPVAAWKAGLTALGLVLSGLTIFVGVRTIEPLLGRAPEDRKPRARRLAWTPYVFSAVVFMLAAAFNPYGPVFIVTTALAHLGGCAWLVWLPEWIHGPRSITPDEAPALSRQRGWLAAGGATFAFLVFVLGRGIRF